MIIGRNRFNIYLLCLLALLACGCRSTPEEKEKKQFAALRLHIESTPDTFDYTMRVPIGREMQVMVTVEKSPFLTEANVQEAKVLDVTGGFVLQVRFDNRGTLLLENYTTSRPGKRIAVYSEFGFDPQKSRWLAAPVTRRISNGTLTFTLDASREEAEQIARGLNNLARQMEKKSQW